MPHCTLPLRASLAALLACSAFACAKDPKATHAEATRVEETSGSITQTEATKATVQEVDVDKRVVTLRDEQGKPFALDVGDSVDLARIKPNDSVRIAYQEVLAFALTDKQAADLTGGPAVEQSTRRIPDGVQFGRKISTTVEMISVTEDGSHATFRVPEGDVRTVYVDDPPSQAKIKNLRPGDAVAVSYTEKLAVALDPAFDD